MVAAPIWDWTGFYVGANGGYSWGRSRTVVDYFNTATGVLIVPPPAGSVTSANFKLDGPIAGGQIGYNWQHGAWVFGFEADAQWSGEKGSSSFLCAGGVAAVPGGPVIPGACLPGLTFLPPGVVGTTLTLNQELEWFGTFRGRVGWLVSPSFLAYVTGGLAFGSVETSGVLAGVTPAGAVVAAAFSNDKTNVGWTVGGGIEAHFGGNWTGKIEYLYMDLGRFNTSVALAPPTTIGANISSRITDHILRVGINYHFHHGPVVARY
jgi:outer membrane immunogenic protein